MKGQISYIESIFALLLTGILAGTIAVILPGQVTKITPEIEAKEFENRVIILANSLLSNPNLIYSDGIVSYRGVFDKEKLDAIKTDPSPIIQFYPETYTSVLIEDIEDGKAWWFHVEDSENEKIQSFLECIEEDIEAILSCVPTRYSNILEGGFPVAIRYSKDNIHLGRIKVMVIE